MPTLPTRFLRIIRCRSYLAGCLSCGCVSLALAGSDQSAASGQNPNPNGTTGELPKPPAQRQQASDAWNRLLGIQVVSEEDAWTRHLRIGAMVGLNISANFNTRGTFGISGGNPAQGIYDDGYVRVDNTGNAFGETGYWGYDNASQLAGSTLALHHTSSYTARDRSEESGEVFPGFDMAYGVNLWDWRHGKIGWDFGFGLLPLNITDHHPMTASVNQTSFTFSTGSILVPVAPYQGGFDRTGEPTIPATVLSTSSSVIPNGTVTDSRQLDVTLYTLRLGPTVYWDMNQYLGLSVSGGPALGIVSGDFDYNETITAGGLSIRNKGSFGDTDLVYGGYVNASLMCHMAEKSDFYMGVQYLPLGNATISRGGREGRLNLGGQVCISAGFNWPF
jgi:hypothetical protein